MDQQDNTISVRGEDIVSPVPGSSELPGTGSSKIYTSSKNLHKVVRVDTQNRSAHHDGQHSHAVHSYNPATPGILDQSRSLSGGSFNLARLSSSGRSRTLRTLDSLLLGSDWYIEKPGRSSVPLSENGEINGVVVSKKVGAEVLTSNNLGGSTQSTKVPVENSTTTKGVNSTISQESSGTSRRNHQQINVDHPIVDNSDHSLFGINVNDASTTSTAESWTQKNPIERHTSCDLREYNDDTNPLPQGQLYWVLFPRLYAHPKIRLGSDTRDWATLDSNMKMNAGRAHDVDNNYNMGRNSKNRQMDSQVVESSTGWKILQLQMKVGLVVVFSFFVSEFFPGLKISRQEIDNDSLFLLILKSMGFPFSLCVSSFPVLFWLVLFDIDALTREVCVFAAKRFFGFGFILFSATIFICNTNFIPIPGLCAEVINISGPEGDVKNISCENNTNPNQESLRSQRRYDTTSTPKPQTLFFLIMCEYMLFVLPCLEFTRRALNYPDWQNPVKWLFVESYHHEALGDENASSIHRINIEQRPKKSSAGAVRPVERQVKIYDSHTSSTSAIMIPSQNNKAGTSSEDGNKELMWWTEDAELEDNHDAEQEDNKMGKTSQKNTNGVLKNDKVVVLQGLYALAVSAGAACLVVGFMLYDILYLSKKTDSFFIQLLRPASLAFIKYIGTLMSNFSWQAGGWYPFPPTRVFFPHCVGFKDGLLTAVFFLATRSVSGLLYNLMFDWGAWGYGVWRMGDRGDSYPFLKWLKPRRGHLEPIPMPTSRKRPDGSRIYCQIPARKLQVIDCLNHTVCQTAAFIGLFLLFPVLKLLQFLTNGETVGPWFGDDRARALDQLYPLGEVSFLFLAVVFIQDVVQDR